MSTIIEDTYKSAIKFLQPMTLSQTYELCVHEATKLVKADYGTIYLFTKDNTIERSYTTLPKKYQSFPTKSGYVYQSMVSGKPNIINRKKILSHHPEYNKNPVQSLIIIPLKTNEKSFGAITLQSHKLRHFTKVRQRALKLFSLIATLGIQSNSQYWKTKSTVELQNLFISLASHELKTPLTTLTVYAQMIQKEKGKLPHPEHVDVLLTQTKRLRELIEELMQAEQIKTGNLTFNPTIFLIKKLVNTLEIDFKSNYPKHQLTINIAKGICQTNIKGDYGKLQQALINVCNNAAKYSNAGTLVTVNISVHGDKVYFDIIDEGKGIATEDIPLLFNKFFRGESNKKGLGLGLYLTKHIIEQHKGTISIDSMLSKGTQVHITLPIYTDVTRKQSNKTGHTGI